MVYLVPFFKNPNFKDVKEANEVKDLVLKNRYNYHLFLQCLNDTFLWHNSENGKLILSTDKTTIIPKMEHLETFRVDTEGKQIIESKVLNETKFICDDNGYEENIIMCGTDHIINRNLDTMFDEDFDIMIPIRKGTRVNNAMIVVKKVTEDVKRFFGYRYDRWVSDAHKDPHWNWYGDQRTYDNILREELGLLPQRDPPKKFRFKLGTYNIRGCKVRLTEYGGEECGSFDIWPKSARVFKPGTYFYDFKGKRKQYFLETFRRERNKHGR